MKNPAPPLPPACPLCRPYGGRWRSVEGGLARCLCPRGEALAAGKVKRVYAGVTGKASREMVKGNGSGVTATSLMRKHSRSAQSPLAGSIRRASHQFSTTANLPLQETNE